jgi:hypothetical protein
MSYLVAAPEFLASAATDLSNIGSTLSEANSVAAAPTTGILAAAEDEVSAAIAAMFSAHGEGFQALSAQAAVFHAQFVQAMNVGAGAYASTEAANAGPLQALAQNLPAPNVAVSADGFKLLQLGNATATAGGSDFAVAFGGGSTATATGGIFNASFATGANSAATATGGNLNMASALGTMSAASTASTGNFNFADAMGANSAARVIGGNLNTASALGINSAATEIGGNLNTASALGTMSRAITSSTGNFNFADAVGANSAATAGAGNLNVAIALGRALTATATGGNMINIVTVFGTL